MTRYPINGTTLNIQIDLVGEHAPWLVMSNSLVTDLSIWQQMLPAFQGWNLLRYDQRGHGESDAPSGAVDFDLLSEDLLAVMDMAGASRAVCMGLSMGVPTTLAAYEKAPERFRALVLMDGLARAAATAKETWGARIAEAREGGMSGYAEITAKRWLTTPETDPGTAEGLRAMIAGTSFAGFEACATALQTYDYAHVLPTLSLPVLLVAGLCDGAIGKTMQEIADDIGAQFQGIPEAGHVPCFERPETAGPVVATFLKGVAR
tara:strand:+ start:40957 stop:41742 length:786 start_codon:yes stop_codon:yes gene_type:complete